MSGEWNFTYSGRCKGTTKAGTQCLHRVVFHNGLCKQHGGFTPPEVMEAYLERQREQLARAIARFDRRLKAAGIVLPERKAMP